MGNLEIGEIARRAGIQSSTVRYYEQRGLLKAPIRVNGRRRYEEKVLDQLHAIQVAQQAGFTLQEIRTLFSGFSKNTPVSARWRAMASQKLVEVDALITKAKRMKQVLHDGLQCECIELKDCLLVLSAKQAAVRGPKKL
jgi:MerR family redox-sensitive transcriptional activator SoxR